MQHFQESGLAAEVPWHGPLFPTLFWVPVDHRQAISKPKVMPLIQQRLGVSASRRKWSANESKRSIQTDVVNETGSRWLASGWQVAGKCSKTRRAGSSPSLEDFMMKVLGMEEVSKFSLYWDIILFLNFFADSKNSKRFILGQVDGKPVLIKKNTSIISDHLMWQ